jgi:hypothetical protein
MALTELQGFEILGDTARLQTGMRLIIPVTEGKLSGKTVMRVEVPGIEPMVDIVHTLEGQTHGPLMRFLGSVASRAELLENGPQTGLIIRGQRLVVAADDRPILLSGTVTDLRAGPTVSRLLTY